MVEVLFQTLKIVLCNFVINTFSFLSWALGIEICASSLTLYKHTRGVLIQDTNVSDRTFILFTRRQSEDICFSKIFF